MSDTEPLGPEPRTEAGQTLAGMLTANGQTDPAMLDYILTIETEAREDACGAHRLTPRCDYDCDACRATENGA